MYHTAAFIIKTICPLDCNCYPRHVVGCYYVAALIGDDFIGHTPTYLVSTTRTEGGWTHARYHCPVLLCISTISHTHELTLSRELFVYALLSLLHCLLRYLSPCFRKLLT